MKPPRIVVLLVALGALFAISQWALSARDDNSLAHYLSTPTVSR